MKSVFKRAFAHMMKARQAQADAEIAKTLRDLEFRGETVSHVYERMRGTV